jgi:hypothetical protein
VARLPGGAPRWQISHNQQREQMSTDDQPLTVKITAEVLPGKEDYAATAWFTNGQRATQYAKQVLIPTGDYRSGGVWLTGRGGARWRLDASEADQPDSAPVDDTEKQYRDQANAIAQQAEALAAGNIPHGRRYAQVHRLFDNISILMAWTEDDRRA